MSCFEIKPGTTSSQEGRLQDRSRPSCANDTHRLGRASTWALWWRCDSKLLHAVTLFLLKWIVFETSEPHPGKWSMLLWNWCVSTWGGDAWSSPDWKPAQLRLYGTRMVHHSELVLGPTQKTHWFAFVYISLCVFPIELKSCARGLGMTQGRTNFWSWPRFVSGFKHLSSSGCCYVV